MKKEHSSAVKVGVYDIALIGMMAAVIEVSKIVLSPIPNVELVSFWIMMFTLFLGPKTIYAILVFTLIEVSLYGVHTWTIMYLYVWPALSLLVWKLRRSESVWFCSILSGFYGLMFGALCSIPYLFIGSVGASLKSGVVMAFNWWVAGIPFDIVHGVANFVLMLVLYTPVRALSRKYQKKI